MLELKVVKGGRKVRLSPHQVAFNIKHASLGCPVFILVQAFARAESTSKESRILLFSGSQAGFLAQNGLETPALVEFPTFEADWGAIKALIQA